MKEYMMLMMSIMFLMGLMKFCFNYKNLLISLLIIEYKVLVLFMMLYVSLNFCMFENFFLMMYIVISVCESALGLSILVSMIRTHGNDYFQGFNMLQC
uniref:NADH-ubiquinone oxidoreductase chain 4L n=1 Tax=Paradoxopsyllus custodis TaxID=3040964 RepID=A0AA95FMG6_9NEOP|nr:NADH dehydrogenase subunit 4L [Paradoxopsyllus custodis]YP_011004246.1 NADH dehydrogenase subunit 4L [Macrostylophora euteles]WGC90512.1 NADH dehydrogenase subunit 4L [Paradoxopsyllus custodis]WPS93595.1 NADH dehydrogenase subunit 4L [Macrostylophora euteles]